jgi:hypothetical protein
MSSDDCARWAGLEIPVGLPRMAKNGLPEILEHGMLMLPFMCASFIHLE